MDTWDFQNPYLLTRLDTIDAEELMAKPIPPCRFTVEGLIPKGLSLLCGRPKTGKSWLVMKLCLCVAQGQDFLGHPCPQGDVLYLALEDTHARLKERMAKLTDEWPINLQFAVEAGTLGGDLRDQLEAHMAMNPNTKLIVIDTLQKIRPPQDNKTSGSSYGNDYREMAELKRFADEHGISIMLVHHLRKMHDSSDPFNEISGTGGILGAVDMAFLLQKESRNAPTAKLIATGRDVEDVSIEMTFEGCEWIPTSESYGPENEQEEIPPVLLYLIGTIARMGYFRGTATELMDLLGIQNIIRPNVLTRMLSGEWYEWLTEYGIEYQTGRTNKGRWISLRCTVTLNACDANDASDDLDSVEKESTQSSPIVTDGRVDQDMAIHEKGEKDDPSLSVASIGNVLPSGNADANSFPGGKADWGAAPITPKPNNQVEITGEKTE